MLFDVLYCISQFKSFISHIFICLFPQRNNCTLDFQRISKFCKTLSVSKCPVLLDDIVNFYRHLAVSEDSLSDGNCFQLLPKQLRKKFVIGVARNSLTQIAKLVLLADSHHGVYAEDLSGLIHSLVEDCDMVMSAPGDVLVDVNYLNGTGSMKPSSETSKDSSEGNNSEIDSFCVIEPSSGYITPRVPEDLGVRRGLDAHQAIIAAQTEVLHTHEPNKGEPPAKGEPKEGVKAMNAEGEPSCVSSRQGSEDILILHSGSVRVEFPGLGISCVLEVSNVSYVYCSYIYEYICIYNVKSPILFST